jgi:predicted GNAT family acetyltransferase
MNKYCIKEKNSGIVELGLKNHPESHLIFQLLENNVYCAVSTYVSPDDRGKGVGKLLYLSGVQYIRDKKSKFCATCPFIVNLAAEDKTIGDIYVNRF